MKTAHSNTAEEFVPERRTFPVLREAVTHCKGCDLYQYATQAVFGGGLETATTIFIGEQPGNEEDLAGKPFVGPAGRLLDRGLEEAGIDRSAVYITNAVKHFKFEERGKRRIHKKPSGPEVRACKPWLAAEIELIRPSIMVCLGATAAQAVFGLDYKVTERRGQFVAHPWAAHATSTIHPSAILRVTDADERDREFERFVADLKKVGELMQKRIAARP